MSNSLKAGMSQAFFREQGIWFMIGMTFCASNGAAKFHAADSHARFW